MATISRYPKFLDATGTVPEKAQFVCRTCKEWFASNCGKTSHIKNNPTHVLYSVKTGLEYMGSNIGTKGGTKPEFHLTNGNGHGSVSPAILEYAFEKMRTEIDAQLDTLHDQLIPPTSTKGPRRTYVAR